MALLSYLDILFMSQSSRLGGGGGRRVFKKSSSKDRSEKIRTAYVCMSAHIHTELQHTGRTVFIEHNLK